MTGGARDKSSSWSCWFEPLWLQQPSGSSELVSTYHATINWSICRHSPHAQMCPRGLVGWWSEPLHALVLLHFLCFTCAPGRCGARGPPVAAPPQQPRRGRLRRPGGQVCGEAPQGCSHRHLQSLWAAGARTISFARSPRQRPGVCERGGLTRRFI